MTIENVRQNNPGLTTAPQNLRITITPRDHSIHTAIRFLTIIKATQGKQALLASCYCRELTTTQGSSFWSPHFKKLLVFMKENLSPCNIHPL